MINAQLLVNDIINKINNITDYDLVHNIILNQIMIHLQQNLQVMFTYVGILPIGVTDPLSGSYTYKTLHCNIDVDKVMNAAKNGLNSWYSQLLYQIKLYTISMITNGTITISSSVPIIGNVNVTQLNIQKLNFNQGWYEIINTLCKDIQMSSPFSPPVPAFSTSGGSGTVTFVKIL